MGDRFESMRARGINTNDATATSSDILQGKTAYAHGQKITGEFVPSYGVGYNVFIQTTEPEEKNGIWIKTTGEQKIKFVSNSTVAGHFLEGNYNFMNIASNTTYVGQVIVGDILYHFGQTSNDSYKLNIRTKENLGNLNVPNITSGASTQGTDNSYAVGAVFNSSDRNIYVFWVDKYDRYYIRSYKYNIDNDTYENIGMLESSSSRTDTTGACTVYDGKVFAVAKQGSAMTGRQNNLMQVNPYTLYYTDFNSFKNYCYDGKYIYILQTTSSTSKVLRINCSTQITETICTLNNSEKGTVTHIFAKGNSLFLFYDNNSNVFSIYNISSGTIKHVNTKTSYSLTSDTNIKQWFLYDEIYGILFFRTPTITLAFQVENNSIDSLENGTQIIIQGFDENITEIDSESNLKIGVSDAFVKESTGIKEYLTCFGDGEYWQLIKNPNDDTFTVTFDTNGGSGSFPSQTKIIGQTITEPQSDPSKAGDYIFDCWYLGNEPYDWNYKPVSDITLTAHYIEYEEVDYIQSTGTQYIDTGVKPNANTKVLAEYYVSIPTKGSYIVGCYGISNTNRFQFNHGSSYFCGYGSSYNNSTTGATTLANRTLEISAGTFKVDNVSVATISSSFDSNAINMYMFANNANGSVASISSGLRIYSFEIYDNNSLVRDFQPIKLSTGEYCMLDKVENKLYHNAGTGDFIGDDYEPTYLEYIESTGTQYIDTGIKANDNTGVEIEFKAMTTTNQVFLGALEPSVSRFQPLNSNNNFVGNISISGDSITYDNSVDTTSTHTLEFNVQNSKVYYDGVEKGSVTSIGSASTSTIYLFARNYSNSMLQATFKLYSCKIYDNGTLVRDFAPCLDINDVPCLWDKVTKNFFYNAGTGDFNYGSVINNG